MRRIGLLEVVGFLLILTYPVSAPAQISIDEAGLRIDVTDDPRLKLPVTKASGAPAAMRLQLDFLDASTNVVRTVTRDVIVPPGSTLLDVDLSEFLELPHAARPYFDWLRMKYTLGESVDGIVSVTRIAEQPFLLDVLKPPAAIPGTRYRVQVLASNPVTGAPVRRAAISGALTFEPSGENAPADVVIRASGRTDSGGYAVLDFDLPRGFYEAYATLEVTGRLGKFTQIIDSPLRVAEQLHLVVNADKPIYQPGQTFRIRVLAFGRSRQARTGVPLKVSISAPDGSDVFRTRITTSNFGEAHAEWEIPDNAPPGDYRIEIAPPNRYAAFSQPVKVSRYELPNFRISAKSDRAYYLPNQNAEIEVRAEYLFGRPVSGAQIKIEMEDDYSTDQPNVVIEGAAREDGTFRATLDLASVHRALANADYDRYRDITYSIYVTDPATRRTEQRQAALRITKSAIHLYVIGDHARGLPLELYIGASYADGSPAECEVAVFEVHEGERRFLGSVTTNRYGVAKSRGLKPSAGWEAQSGRHALELRAADGKGGTVAHVQHVFVADARIRLITDKTLYRASDPITVALNSTRAEGALLFSVMNDEQLLYNTIVRLENGRATITVPNSRSFKGSVRLFAYQPNSPDGPEAHGSRLVSFPEEGELEITAETPKPVYRPGDEATVRFRVKNRDGVPRASLLGITVLDQAVEERARTEAQFGSGGLVCRYCSEYFGGRPVLHGLRIGDAHAIDRDKPVPADLELAAEVVLAASNIYSPAPYPARHAGFTSYDFEAPLGTRLHERTRQGKIPSVHDLPADEDALRNLLSAADPGFETLRDSWGNPFRLQGVVNGSHNEIQILSAGPDERFPSEDDFVAERVRWPFFQEYGGIIVAAMRAHHERTGGYIRDISTLESELLRAGHDFGTWRDPGGGRYRAEFGIEETRFTITVLRMENGRPVPVWSDGLRYTEGLWLKVENALSRHYTERGLFPETEEQLRAALESARVPDADMTDPWGRRFYAVFGTRSQYVDRVTYQAGLQESVNIAPATQEVRFIVLKSAGPDGVKETEDDFTIDTFLRAVRQHTAEDRQPVVVESPILQETKGAIGGFVADVTGARIPGVSIKITNAGRPAIEALTGAAGEFMVPNLEPGVYRLEFSMPGFQQKTSHLRVRAGVVTNVTSVLEVSSIATMVVVSAPEPEMASTSSASLGLTGPRAEAFIQAPAPLYTPRLREYFPETLFWQPALETGRDGGAQVRFRLADSITTWKVAVIASTKDGQVGLAEKEIVSTQPFFLEHDPPRYLTAGDEITLPTIVRSYLEDDQSLELTLAPANWLAALGPSSQKLELKAGQTTQAAFRFRAVAPVKDGAHRVTGIGAAAADAVQKTTSVGPNGRQITQTSSRILRGAALQEVTVPPEAMPGTISAELKIYPDLTAHIIDGIHAIMKRPYGCAEQVISSAYPSLLYLRHSRHLGRPETLRQRAVRYIQQAYEKLRQYQTGNGGFSYWERGEADLAVTAYAVQFLHDAAAFVEVDERVYSGAGDWLIRQQAADGSWRSDVQLTSLIARVLSSTGLGQNSQREAVARALAFLQQHAQTYGEPYAVASLALAALDFGERQVAENALRLLERSAHSEGDGVYWALQTNTPFYTWGLPGRLETTALAVEALLAGRSADEPLVEQGLIFLLRNKDRFGLWHTTQTTVRVLDALAGFVVRRSSAPGGSFEIFVNDVRVRTVKPGGKDQFSNPVSLDISRFLSVGANRVEVRQPHQGAAAIQLVTSYYVPWNATSPEKRPGSLRFSVQYAKTEAVIGDEITAVVTAERVGFRGYGMMLAEVGLPPGADVDRASLEEAVRSAGVGFYKYEVLPDRIIAYLWPRAGGSRFEFKFRMRYGLRAQAPASSVYDYYNPEERVVVPPTQFVVR